MKRKIKNWLAVFLALIMGLGTLTAQETLLEENFSSSTYPPDGWTRYTGTLDGSLSSSTSTWTRRTTTPISGGYSVAFNMYNTRNYWLVTPSITLPANSTLELDVAATKYNNANPATSMGSNEIFYIVVSTDGGETWTTENVVAQYDYETSPSLSDFTTPTHLTVSLANYTGDVKIGFYGHKPSSGGDWDIHIGNILVSAPASCNRPTVLTVEDITSSAAAVSWTMNESNPNASINLQYTLATDANWENPIATITNATNPYSLTELIANTQYKVRVQADCGAGDVSSWKEATFKTLCATIVVTGENAWEENFDSESTLNSCMALSDSYFAFATSNNSNGRIANSGTNYIYAKWSANTYAFTPYFDLVAGTPYKFTFMYVTDGSEGWTTLEAGLFTDQNSSALVSAVGTPVSGPTNTTYTQYKGVFTPTESGTYCIGIHVQSSDSPWYMSIDDLSLGLAPSCVEPTGLAVSNITSSSAQVSWTGDAESYQLSYAVTGEDDYTTTTVSGNTYTIPSLDANTNYTVEIKSICGSDLSDAATTTFKTECAAIVVTDENAWTEDFETLSTSDFGCWTDIQEAGSDNWDIQTYSGNKAAHRVYSTGSNRLVSPTLDITGLTAPFLTYDWEAHMDGSYLDNIYVYYRTNSDGEWTLLAEHTSNASLSISSVSQSNIVALPNATATYQIAFLADCHGGYGVAIDNVVVKNITCAEPADVAVSGITTSSATVAWTGDAESYQLKYKTTAEEDWTTVTTSANPYTIESLTANTSYMVELRSVCGNDLSDAAATSFSTPAPSVTEFPYNENFEGVNQYVAVSGTGTNQWFIGSATGNDGNSLYISNDNGVSNAYSLSESDAYAIINVVFGDAVGYDLSFDWKANGENGWDMLNVYLLDVDAALPSGRQTSNSNAIFHQSAFQESWTNTEAIELAGVSNTSKKIVFHWYNDGYGDSQPPAAVDNISIVAKNCATPTVPTVENITVSTADVAWTEEGITVVEYKTAADENWTSVSVTASPKTLTDLTSNTTYTVRTGLDCAGEMLYSPTTTFKTECAAISVAETPYTTSFEDDATGSGTVPACWTKVSGSSSPYVYTSSYSNYARTGSKTLYWSYNTNPIAIALPAFVEDVKDLQVSFFARNGYSAYDMQVGVMTDPTDAETFEQVATVSLTTSYPEEAYVVRFKSYTGAGQYIALRPASSSSYYVDDVTVELAPTCFEPENVVASNITTSSATITWEDESESTAWTLEYKKANETEYTAIEGLTEKTYNLPSLDVNTIYNVRVTGNCVGGETVSDVVTFSTSALNVTAIPFTENFEESNSYVQLSGTGTNQWFVGNATATVDGENSLYVSNDEGATNAYTHSESNAYAVMNIEFGDAEEYFLSFDWKSRAESSSWDRLMVFLMDENEDLSTLSRSYTTGRIFNQSTFTADPTWQNALITLNDVQNTTKKLVFYWYNDGTGGNNPPAAIDNITIAECVAPSDIVVSDVTETTADLVWNDLGGSNTWTVEYKQTSEDTWTTVSGQTTKTYAFEDLRPNTSYDVRVAGNCNATKYSDVAQFTTLCLPTASEREATICDNETYTDADFTLTAENEGINEIVLQNQYGCDSTITLTLTVNPTYAPVFDVEICEGESYTENNFNIENPEVGGYTYVQNLQTVNGCDSIVTLNLTVNPVYNDEPVVRTICYGEQVEFAGETFDATGVYERTLPTINGCDSVVTLDLTVIRNLGEENIEICEGQSYQFKDEEWTLTGTYVRVFEGENGDCDTTVTYNLTVNPLKTSTIDAIITYGTSYTENGFNENETGTYTLTTPSLLTGCDSTVTLNLTVMNALETYKEATICANESYTDQDFVEPLTLAGVYRDTLVSERYGIDSIIVLTLNVNPIYKNEPYEAEICAGEEYTDENFVEPLKESGIYTKTLQSVNGCDSVVAVNLVVYPTYDIVIDTAICEGQSFVSEGFNVNATGTYYQRTQTAEGCDSIVTLHLTVNPIKKTNLEATICEGESYTENNFDVAGTEVGEFTYTQNLETYLGCDSTVTLTLTVNPVKATELEATICQGQTYTENNFDVAGEEAGVFTYTQNLETSLGCDSTVTLTLTVNPIYNPVFDVVICEGESYTENNFNENTTGTYTQNLQTENGCDSIVTLNLTVNPVKTTNLEATICSGATYSENNFNVTPIVDGSELEPGQKYKDLTYTQNLQTYLGCDSTVTLTLHVRPQYEEVITAEICKGETYTDYDFNAKRSGQYIQYRTTVDGCDSNLVLNLTVNPIYTKDVTEYICKGTSFEFGGETLTEEGEYTHTFQTVKGCDSVVNLTLRYYPYYDTTRVTAEICDGQTYDFHGESFTQAGTYERTLQTINGCDSVVALTVVVNPVKTTPLTETICSNESYDFFGTTLRYAGTYNHTLQTTKGCDSVISLTLVVNPVKTTEFVDVICQGQTYAQYGFNIVGTEAGDSTYTQNLQTYLGCDSTVTLHLTVNPVKTTEFVDTICQGQSYTENNFDVAGTEAGVFTYTQNLQTISGCDSIVTLTLTVNPVKTTNFEATICQGQSYTENNFDVTATEAGVFTHTQNLQTYLGCDSTVTLTLTVNPVKTTELVETICSGTLYTENNFNVTAYTEDVEKDTVIVDSLQTYLGCDSIVTLTLHVLPIPYSNDTIEICSGDTINFNGEKLYQAGDYTYVLAGMGSNGCDSVAHLNLIVNPIFAENRVVNICPGTAYDFYGQRISVAGNYEKHFETVNGCDSVVYLQVIVNPVYEGIVKDVTICEGEEYAFAGETLTEAGSYTRTLQTINGCDSTVTLNLSVTPLNNQVFDVAICEGQTYTENGFNASETGTYTREVVENECTSTWTLNLTVNPVYDTVIEATICEGATYTENGFSADLVGTYYRTLQTVNGCDSLVTLHLQMTDMLETAIEATICSNATYEFDGQDLNEEGVYTANLTGVGGCDSVVTLTLHVNDVLTSEFDAAICQGQSYDWNGIACTENTDYVQTFQSVSGCDSVVTLHLTVYPVENTVEEATICEGATYTWNNVEYTEAGTYELTLQNANGCDYTATLNLNMTPNIQNEETISFCEGSSVMYKGVEYDQAGTYILTSVNPETQCTETTVLTVTSLPIEDQLTEATICEGTSYTWNGTTYTEPGTYPVTLQNENGCNYTSTLALTVNPIAHETIDQTICQGSAVQFGNLVLSSTGSYTQTFQSVVTGCDSVVTLNLTVSPNKTTTTNVTICEGETYEFNGEVLAQAGLYSATLPSYEGCDSTVTLNLIVNAVKTSTINATICEGETYEFNNQTLSEAGQYTAELQAVSGCDSIVTLNLTVNPLNNQTFNATICEGEVYNQNGFVVSQAGTYTREVVANGCTSIWTLNLTVTPANNQTISATICQGEIYTENGFIANQSGTYTRQVVENGCTSIWTLNLTVLPVYAQTISATICEGESYEFNGQSYTEAGTYTASLQTINGCDSTVTLNLSVTPLNNQTFNATICEGEIYNQNGFMANQTGTYTREVVANGCTSTWTLNLTVTPTNNQTFNATICQGEIYNENGFMANQSGTYTREVVENGCTSIWTLNLTVLPVYAQTISATICEGESYTFNGQSYTEAGTYTASLQTINGCDSTVTLNLSVTPLNNQTFNATICQGEIYNQNGFMANESGTYTREVVENGCTSIWTLNLTVLPLQTETIDETICYGETFTYNGQTYSQTGTYTTTIENADACPTVVTINLTVLPLQTETIDETICYGETFTYNGQTYSQTGTYTTVVEGEDGACNTEVTINLVVRDANADIDELVVLNNADLPYEFMGNEYTDYGTYVVTVQDENGCEQVYNLTIQHNSGLNAVESNVLVSVYPNPTIDNATLRVEGLTEDATVVVTDQTGRMISSERLALGQTEMTINSASLAEGVYYIRIITSNSTRTEKLIRR